MAWFARRLSIPVRVALVVSFVVVATGVGPRTAAAPAKGTEILWDTYGVPHIFAPDHPSLFHAYGYAQMEGHAELLVRLYAQARGTRRGVLRRRVPRERSLGADDRHSAEGEAVGGAADAGIRRADPRVCRRTERVGGEEPGSS